MKPPITIPATTAFHDVDEQRDRAELRAEHEPSHHHQRRLGDHHRPARPEVAVARNHDKVDANVDHQPHHGDKREDVLLVDGVERGGERVVGEHEDDRQGEDLQRRLRPGVEMQQAVELGREEEHADRDRPAEHHQRLEELLGQRQHPLG